MNNKNENDTVKDCEAILEAMQVPDQKSVYCVGSFEKGKITIHSQQTRALNLAYALIIKELCTVDDRGCLQIKKTYKSIAIVGAGFSGMTIAYALSNIPQVNLHVFDQYQGSFNMQRKSDRVIHPNVFDWPAHDCGREKTTFPFFNWQMREVKDVINMLSKQLDLRNANYKTSLKQYNHVKITRIESDEGVVTISQGKDNIPAFFDIAIVCVGFGKEEIHKQSYWLKDNDDVNSTDKKSRYLISGNGDGGIIDSIRMSLYDFRYDDFITELVNNSYLKAVGTILLESETAIGFSTRSDGEKADELYTLYEKAVQLDETFKQVKELLRKHKKSDIREVHLVGRSASPFSFSANPLNKLLISIFCHPAFGYIKYHSSIEEFKKHLVPPVNQKNSFLRAFFNQIRNLRLSIEMGSYKKLLRTGPTPVVYLLFKEFKKEIIEEKIKQLKQLNIGNKQYWQSVPDFFTSDGFNIDDQYLGLPKKADNADFNGGKGSLIL